MPTQPNKSGKSPARSPVAALRGMAPTSHSDGAVAVDRANGIIKNVSLMTIGEALGWPFDIDGTTLDQLIQYVNADPNGIKCRFAHPKVSREMGPDGEMEESVEDDIGRVVGRIKSARRDGDCARGDLYIGDYAANLPALGDVKSYLLAVAESDPTSLGMSAMFPYSTDPQIDDAGRLAGNPARLHGLDGIDLVGKPAANPAGLLSARQRASQQRTTPGGVVDTTTAPNIGTVFDPQPPSPAEQIGPSGSGWQEPDPREMHRAPTPANTIEFPDGTTQPYLGEMLANGYLSESHFRAAMTGLCKAGMATYCGGVFLPTDKARALRAQMAARRTASAPATASTAHLKRTITYDAAGKVLSVTDSKP